MINKVEQVDALVDGGMGRFLYETVVEVESTGGVGESELSESMYRL